MGHTGKKFDLEQMQKYFEAEAGNLRCISDYQLSEADYKSLGVKLKALLMLEPTYDWMREFILPITIFVTYSYIYDTPDVIRDFSYQDMQKNMSQYQIRQNIHDMLNCIHDFGFLDFGYNRYNFKKACNMTIARHAGIPNEEKYIVFEIISEYQDVPDTDVFYEGVFKNLPPKTRRVLHVLDEGSRHELLSAMRDLMSACSATAGRKEILEKFPNLSISLIDHCIFWCENQRMQERMGSCS